MVRISEVVTFFLQRAGHAVIHADVSRLPQRPPSPPRPPPKKETTKAKAERKKIREEKEKAMKAWDPIDKRILDELDSLRYLHAALKMSDSSKPSGYVERRSEDEKLEEALKGECLKHGVHKTRAPPTSAAKLSAQRGKPVSEETDGLFSLMYPEVFCFGLGDFNDNTRKTQVPRREHLEWLIFQDTSVFHSMAGWNPEADSATPAIPVGPKTAKEMIQHHLQHNTPCRFTTAGGTNARKKKPGTACGARFELYRRCTTLRHALDSNSLNPACIGNTKGGATLADLQYDLENGLLLIGDGAGIVVPSNPGAYGSLPAMSANKLVPHALNMFNRKEAMAQANLFLREQVPRKMTTRQWQELVDSRGKELHSKILAYGKSLPGSPQEIKRGRDFILATYEELGPPCLFSTLSFPDTHDPNLHRFIVSFAGLGGTVRDPSVPGIAPNEASRRRQHNLADYPAVVVWYWKERMKRFHEIVIRVLGFTHIIARAEFQGRGSEHEHALWWHPNKPPDDFLDTIAAIAHEYVKQSSTPADFCVRAVADVANQMALNPRSIMGYAAQLKCFDPDEAKRAAELCAAATQWYDSMLHAGNGLFERHGADFVPRGGHPSQDFPHEKGKAAEEADFADLEADYYKTRHCTCRHGDCTSDYCQRSKKVEGKDVIYCRFAEQLALRTRPTFNPNDGKQLGPCPSPYHAYFPRQPSSAARHSRAVFLSR